jgi:hypothetical protein
LTKEQREQITEIVTLEQYDKTKEIVNTILTNMDVDMLKIIRYFNIYIYNIYYVIYT